MRSDTASIIWSYWVRTSCSQRSDLGSMCDFCRRLTAAARSFPFPFTAEKLARMYATASTPLLRHDVYSDCINHWGIAIPIAPNSLRFRVVHLLWVVRAAATSFSGVSAGRSSGLVGSGSAPSRSRAHSCK